jgi:hypothetical protein
MEYVKYIGLSVNLMQIAKGAGFCEGCSVLFLMRFGMGWGTRVWPVWKKCLEDEWHGV